MSRAECDVKEDGKEHADANGHHEQTGSHCLGRILPASRLFVECS